MIYCVVVRDLKAAKQKLLCVFSNRLSAELWLAGVSMAQLRETWVVLASDQSSFWPKKIVRWMFSTKEEAEKFVKSMRVEEKKTYKWLN